MNVFELASGAAAPNGQSLSSPKGVNDSKELGTSSFETHLSKEVQDQKASTEAKVNTSRDQGATEQNASTPSQGTDNSSVVDDGIITQDVPKPNPLASEFKLSESIALLKQPDQSSNGNVKPLLADVRALNDVDLTLAEGVEESIPDAPLTGIAVQPAVNMALSKQVKLSLTNEGKLTESSAQIPSSIAKQATLSESQVRLPVDVTTTVPETSALQVSNNGKPLSNLSKQSMSVEATSFSDTLSFEQVESKNLSQARNDLNSSLGTVSLAKAEEGLAPSTARFSVNVQFGRAEWMADVAAQVSKVAAQNLNFAEIQLDPPELGPLQVRVQVNNDQATVSFTAQSAQVREALEQNGTRLRELFGAEGMDLVDVDVSDQSQQNPEDELESERADRQEGSNGSSDPLLSESSVLKTEIKVGVDDYV